MSLRCPLLWSLCVVFAGSAFATDAHIGNVVVGIPPGFSGPHHTRPNDSTENQNFVASRGDGLPGTVIQLTRMTMPAADPNISERDRYKASSGILRGFLRTLGEQRTNYSLSAIEELRLAGILSARARWNGELNERPLTGAMYCVVVGKDVFVLHAFGGGPEPSAELKRSVQALEGLRVIPAHKSQERTLGE